MRHMNTSYYNNIWYATAQSHSVAFYTPERRKMQSGNDSTKNPNRKRKKKPNNNNNNNLPYIIILILSFE